MKVGSSAAYQGAGWQPRKNDLAGDVREGRLWRTSGNVGEFGVLRTAMIGLPSPDWPIPGSWNEVQYLGPVNFGRLRAELIGFVRVLEEFDVEVIIRELQPSRTGLTLYNSCFVRDQFFMTPEGAVVARMASIPRAGEEFGVAVDLARAGIPVLATISGFGTFEGADALWLRPDLVLVGSGSRTNVEGVKQVRAILGRQNVTVIEVPVPAGIQHLLGVLQLVDHDLAMVRTELTNRRVPDVLAEHGVRVVHVSEVPSVTRDQAMNFVVLGPRRVIMVDGAPSVAQWFADNGVEVVATTPCPQLIRAAGGLGCVTGIVYREEPRDGEVGSLTNVDK